MKAFVMAAGYGTRMEPLTKAIPKPMVPIVNFPAMYHNLMLLKKYWVKDIMANIHYFPEQIEGYFGDGEKFGINLNYSYEEELMGTAGGVWRMARHLSEVKSTFLVLSSDALTDINLGKLIDYHKKKKGIATIALYPVQDPSHFGVVILDKNNKITAFQEKPKKGEELSNLVNTGIYVFEPEILDLIPPHKFYDFGKQVFPELVKNKGKIYGYEMEEYWSDVGNLKQYHVSMRDAMQGRLLVEVPGHKVGGETWVGAGSEVHPTARFEGPIIIGEKCKIGPNVTIAGETVIGDMCAIGPGTEINQGIIWSHSSIGSNSVINESVIGSWCYLDEKVVVEKESIVANRSKITAGKHIKKGTKLLPDTIL